MSSEDKSDIPLFSPEDENVAQRELENLRKHLRKNGTLKTTRNWTGFQGKTLWDWLQLLLIPLVLTVGGFMFSTYQHDADQQRALDQQQAIILQMYTDNIQDLLLNHHLLASKPTDDVAILARARTLTALQGLNPKRKGSLMQFLYEAHLIGYLDSKNIVHPQTINLDRVDLSLADFTGANLSGANLSGANLNGAIFKFAILTRANLSCYTVIPDIIYDCVSLFDVDFSEARLDDANFAGAVGLTQNQLDQVSYCFGAILPKGLKPKRC